MEYIQQVKEVIFRLTNEVRKNAGLYAVKYSFQLDRMGQIHTNEMYTV